MVELVLHPDTRRELEAFTRRPAHALVIIGPEGSGKRSMSELIVRKLLELSDGQSLANHPFVRIAEPDGTSISIESIRGLISFTKLKIAGERSKTQRVIVIDKAGAMTTEAQNALLKLLEEPPAGTVFLLNAANAESLLQTVRSRSQHLVLKQPVRIDLETHFLSNGFSAKQIQSAYLMSGGLPGLMHALLGDDTEHPLAKASIQARNLLRAKTFERLCAVDGLSKQKADSLRLLFILQQMARAALANAAKSDSSERTIKLWQRILSAAYNAENALNSQAQAKLVLTNFMLNM